MYIYIYMCVYLCIFMYIYVYFNIYINISYIYIHTYKSIFKHRETIKNISKLIIERDVAAKKAKLKLEEAIVRKHMESKNG
jgi:hypothetical protein